ncbi:MAG: hypothetical protein JSV04_13240 [Candidatus Heimdallarchaeota archaeon]|nr:MAG: hypothetical protein JSV04_13240 [Candidatus Heimdallarchaeota archaeon]
MNNTEFRTSTSIASEINRLVREIENRRSLASDFYEELREHASYLKTVTSGSDSVDEKKRRFKRIGALLEELKEYYWDLTDLLTELNGIEILESNLIEHGAQLSRDLVGILKQMEPIARNTYKSLHSNELGSVGNELSSVIENSKFLELNEVLTKLFIEIDQRSSQLKDLKHKRIL